jgi:hypothetical protein
VKTDLRVTHRFVPCARDGAEEAWELHSQLFGKVSCVLPSSNKCLPRALLSKSHLEVGNPSRAAKSFDCMMKLEANVDGNLYFAQSVESYYLV